MRLIELDYHVNTTTLFSAFAEQPWSIWLDSCADGATPGRYDIFAAQPKVTLVCRGNKTTITRDDGQIQELKTDPLLCLQNELARLNYSDCDLPFSGGALGYLSYDLSRRFENLPEQTLDDEDLPEMAMGIYNWAVVVDHQLKMTTLIIQGTDQETEAQEVALLEQLRSPYKTRSFYALSGLKNDISKDEYGKSFSKIKDYIKAGDCYQINYAQRFQVECQGSVFAAYEKLRQLNSAPYAAYLHLPFVTVMSSSPELFLSCEDGHVVTKPIKGTAPRTKSSEDDNQAKKQLANSTKDKAENVMIVDLLRNDFSKNCVPHSVKVPKLFTIESYAMVHHMVSKVTGILHPEKSSMDLIRGAFPGGSITGAPKIRAMEIIDELETYRRGVYCGSIGFINHNANTKFNIAIRTMTYLSGKMRFWAGGGIVHDSTMEGEYQETLDKAAAIIAALAEVQDKA